MVVDNDTDQFGRCDGVILVLAGDFKGKTAAGWDFDGVERNGPQTVHLFGNDVLDIIAHRDEFELVLFQNSEGVSVVTHGNILLKNVPLDG